MSALRAVHRTPLWNKSDYVCLCCRRRLLAQHQQERTYSNDASSPEVDDDWFANFNNLCAEPLAKKHGDVKYEPMAKEEVAQPPQKEQQTRRQRIAGGSFSSLKSSLSSRLRTPPAAEPTQGQDDSQSKQSGNFSSPHSHQPFPGASSSNADLGLFNELRSDLQSAIRKKSPRRVPRDGPVVDVYRASPAAVTVSSSRPRDEKLEAVIQELRAVWSIRMLQMIQDIQKKRDGAQKPGLSDGFKSQQMFGNAMYSQHQSGSRPSVQHPPERAKPEYRGHPTVNKALRFVKTEGPHQVSGIGNESVKTQESHPAITVSSVKADVSEPAKQIMPNTTMNSLLVDLAKSRSRIMESEQERAPENEPEHRVVFDMAPDSVDGAQVDGSLPSVRRVDSIAGRGSTFSPRALNSRPLFKDDKAELHNNIGDRAMSSMAQKATELLNDLNSNNEAVPPWEVEVSKADPNVDNEVPSSVDASQILGTLYPKLRGMKPSRTSRSEGKDKKVSGKKSKRAHSAEDSKKDAGSKKSRIRRTRSRVAVKKSLSSAVTVRNHLPTGEAVRKLLISKNSHGEPTMTESGSAEPTTTKRKRSSARVTKSIAAETPISVDIKDGDEDKTRPQLHQLQPALSALDPSDVVSIDPNDLEITPLNVSQPPVPGLQHSLDRVLFNPGVFQLQDPHSRVYNFDPYLQKIMPVVEFDYNALKQYKTSSQDSALSDLAKEHGKRYIGSTSSMTGTLGHFHYLLSNFRPLNLKMLSRSFPDSLESFTQINRAPNAIFLRNKGDGIYAIDADKEFDGPNVLMMLGKSMEKLLTLPKADYERYKKEHSHLVTEEERTAPEAYEYTTMGDFLMRSQLDAHDSRLPGTGMFDLKTRAVVSVRMNASDYEPMTGYEIQTLQGRFQSYEREYYDMMRSTMLKYMLQVRMGRMDGIFLAYHNVERIFGFQYVPLHELDRAIHSQTDRCLGDQEFKLSLDLLNKVLDKAIAKFPDASLRLHFETMEEQIGGGTPTTMMWVYAEPVTEDEINRIQSRSYERTAEFERTMMGIGRDDSVDVVSGIDAEDNVNGSEDTAPRRSQAELVVLPESDSPLTTSTEPPPSTEDAGYSSTATDAAPTFTGTLETHVGRELQPLFAASIVCKSRVNGSPLPRPEKLKPGEKWELEYLLQEWNTSELTWSRYEDLKSRRKAIFDKLRKESEDEDAGVEEGGGKKKSAYIDFLKSMSQQGRAFRDRINELEAGKEPVVVGQPFGKVEDGVGTIEGLDDYLGWLYREDAPRAQER